MPDQDRMAEELSRLIGRIYDASLDHALWPGALEATCAYMSAPAAAITVHDAVERSGVLTQSWGDDPSYTKRYVETYARLNPLTLPILLAAPGDVMSISDVMDYEAFKRSRLYREWAAPQGYADAIVGLLERSAARYASITVIRPVEAGLADEAARNRLRLLVPHFQRAVLIAGVIDLSATRAASLAQTLDGLAAAVFIVDRDRRVLHANRAGNDLAGGGAVLSMPGGVLTLADEGARATLADALLSVSAALDRLGAKGTTVVLRGRDAARYSAHLMPIRAPAWRDLAEGGAVAAVFVRPLRTQAPVPTDILARTYGLTSAEMRVVVGVVETGSVPKAAEALCLSEHTVKGHLKTIFKKTGVRSQMALARLIASLGESPAE